MELYSGAHTRHSAMPMRRCQSVILCHQKHGRNITNVTGYLGRETSGRWFRWLGRYWPSFFDSLLATFTPLNPLTYFDTPR
jgi:hypothetical protein